jgi:hypothetical protein
MAGYAFNAADARRIAEVVRAAEHGRIGNIGLGADAHEQSKPGVRLLIGKHEGTEWNAGETAVVTIYNGDINDTPKVFTSAGTLIAYNQYIQFTDNPVCTARWVALAHNGFAWHPIDSQDDCPGCISEVGGIEFAIFPGFEKTQTQILGHDASGCVRWYDIFACQTAPE